MEQVKKPPFKVKPPKAKSMAQAMIKKYLGTVLYIMIFGIIGFVYALFVGDVSLAIKYYLFTQIGALVLGIAHAALAPRLISWIDSVDSVSMIIFLLMLTILGFTIIYFSTSVAAIPDIPLNYAWALLLFILPTLWTIAYVYLLNIPAKQFKTWIYPYGKEVPVIEVVDPIKIHFYIEKKVNDDSYSEFTLNVPPKYKLGEFMHYFIHRYNYDKNPDAPIFISSDNSEAGLYRWLFRRKPHSMKNAHVLDPDKSFADLGLLAQQKIIIERSPSDDSSESKFNQELNETDEK